MKEMTIFYRSFLLIALIVALPSGTVSAVRASTVAGAAYGHIDAKTAGCIARRNIERSTTLVNSVPGSPDERRALDALGADMERCGVAASLVAGPQLLLLRGHISESLWRSRGFSFGESEPRNTDSIVFTNGFDDTAELPMEYGVALCVVYKYPGGVAALIRTAPGTAAEKAVVASLTPSLSACLPHGQNIALKVPQLRAILAEHLVRRYPPPDLASVSAAYEPSITISRKGDPGPSPTVARFQELGGQAIKGIFAPVDVSLTWTNGISSGSVRPFGTAVQRGWWTCGQVSVKRGVFTEHRAFLVVVRDDTVRYDAVGSQIGIHDFIALACGAAEKRGWMPVSGTIARAEPTPGTTE